MYLYIYSFNPQTKDIVKDTFEVKECSKTYILSSNHNIRFPKDKIDKINPENHTLITLNPDYSYAASLFKRMFMNQIQAFQETINILNSNIRSLNRKVKS